MVPFRLLLASGGMEVTMESGEKQQNRLVKHGKPWENHDKT
jgi:hypothetical protein